LAPEVIILGGQITAVLPLIEQVVNVEVNNGTAGSVWRNSAGTKKRCEKPE